MKELLLSGLDGSNPLGFLAALGALNVVSDAAKTATPRLAWKDDGVWRAALASPHETTAELVKALRHDLTSWRGDPVLHLKYEKKGAKAWDLKPPPEVFRRFLAKLLECGNHRAIDFVSAFAAEGALDNNDNTKPTALHFTAGQQQFLEMVDLLVRNVTDKDLESALFGPWRYDRDLPVLNWDATASRDYALRAKDPAKEKLGNPGADWLAFRGLSFLRVFASKGKLLTTGCSGKWKFGSFRWPLWACPIERETVRTLLTLQEFPLDERPLRGIAVVYECVIRRTDQGGYGSFAPSTVV